MKHNLFLVHGMGVHETGSWADDVKDKIKETAGRYAFFEDLDLEERINFLPISYDQKLNELLQLWKEHASEMSSFLESQELDPGFSIPEILNVFENADEKEKKFFWTHIADVLIYRFFVTYRASIRTHVTEQFVSKINWIKENNPDHQSSTVIAHSLGTIVTHDALHMLGSNLYTDAVFEPADWTFQRILTLANVSRVMKSDFDPYSSIVRPASAGNPAYFKSFVNVRHKFDPFLIPFPFAPTNWGNKYASLELNHFHEWNIHSFEHYLDHPKVHIPLFRSIVSSDCISDAEMQEAYSSYDSTAQFGGKLKCIGEAKEVIDNELIPLVQGIDEQSGLLDFIPVLMESYSIYEKIKEISEGCNA